MTETAINSGLGTQLRRLLELLDGELEGVYRDSGLDWRPKYTPIYQAIAASGPLTVGELAQRAEISQPAASQTLKEMARKGLIGFHVDDDGRRRPAFLTPDAVAMKPTLEGQWRATQRAADALDRELSTPLSKIVREAVAALEEKPFRARIEAETGAAT